MAIEANSCIHTMVNLMFYYCKTPLGKVISYCVLLINITQNYVININIIYPVGSISAINVLEKMHFSALPSQSILMEFGRGKFHKRRMHSFNISFLERKQLVKDILIVSSSSIALSLHCLFLGVTLLFITLSGSSCVRV